MAAPATSRFPPRATGTSLAAMVLALVTFAAVMVLHVVRADLDPLSRVMSEYANGAHGIVMTIAFYAAGLSCLALAFRLRREPVVSGPMRIVLVLLLLAGGGLVVSGVFEVGRAFVPDTMEETAHSASSIGAFMCLIAAMLLFSFAAWRSAEWHSFAPVSGVLAVVAGVAGAVSPVVTAPSGAGFVQRVLGGSVLLWLLLVARRIRSNAFRSSVSS